MTMIHLKNVSFSYGSKIVLNGMDFELREGKKVALVGANGCGKTTLCHIVMGLLAPQSGDVEILGKERKKESDFSEIRGKIGFLFQDSDDQLFCPTVIEDVAFGPLNLGQTPEQAKKTVTQTLNALKLNGFEDRITYKLSGGEKRLVSLATVLAMEPEYLILDEPTTGLDESTVDRLVMILNDSPLGYLIISHDREFVKRTAKEVFRLKDGKIEHEEKI
jgi:cobalt/nickel transport system ATP-binding protein